ncbi:hypothetical protein [Photobacterium damselae]|uniref:hypothetical protein n=1 Tax=Photobacterium damselae TaxID=38293 RepID=UPI004067EBCE
MNQYLFNVKRILFLVFFLVYPSYTFSTSITGTLTGDTIKWNNAYQDNGDIIQTTWQLGSKLNLLPVREWTPAISRYISPTNDIVFKSSNMPSSSHGVSVEFYHVGIEFKSSAPFSIVDNGSSTCSMDDVSAGYVSLREYLLSSCQSGYSFLNSKKYRPFDFYRLIFKFGDIATAFKGKPSGIYHATINIPIKYIVKFGSTVSYEIRNETVTFIINYTASFLDDVLIKGDGVMALDYDTDEHSVKGKTKFKVSVRGHLANGLKMSFKSSNVEKDFSLEHTVSKKRIPYSLRCNRCDETQVILDGRMLNDSALISSPFDRLDFNLDFYFNKMYFNKVDKGEYLDEITIRFEPNL